MHTDVKIFDAHGFGAAKNRVLKCTWQESMYIDMKIFDALDIGAAVNRLHKCTWQETMHTGMRIFDEIDFVAAGGSCVHLARKYAHSFGNI